ncbi:hypothetical protein [Cyclobacterium jeungdonense]|uniref:Uncharacterized protein n=1 Tax=Cyclobacterium jeungdonense TaxID=708087 RepID=A0ABT8C7F0_9BACT|nr:hypothetical protein [Cyclobacterium jeungdonense]MDN3688718.1 hypothetical protein [Cyclobacterium jeungdonense]
MSMIHSFHIPVMGLGFTVDSPLKVARFGISSVVSIMDDQLLEDMRRIYSRKLVIPYFQIEDKEPDARAKRVKAYLNFLQSVVNEQVKKMKKEAFGEGNEIDTYFELLPEGHPLNCLYSRMQHAFGSEKLTLQEELRKEIVPGNIDVNIMTKVDKINYAKDGQALPREYSDALAALRGFAQSDVNGGVVFSAGMNPALYSYAVEFSDFFPDQDGIIKKPIILKVSDYRSALIQGKFLAKKGLWVSEFRIESGLNCGGHAFATDGFLAGPILESFKQNKADLRNELVEICQQALQQKNIPQLPKSIRPKITYQGGIGTAEENQMLLQTYDLDGTGWGSPFLLVPEATSVDKETLDRLLKAKKSDFYLSRASPLGVPFNNLRTSSGEEQRKGRIDKDRPGSPCYKKLLASNTEFTEKPICTASRQYQLLKIKQREAGGISASALEEILEKDCLCEGLGAPAILASGETPRRNLKAVTICPGPNLAYFKGAFSLKEMVDHIYGKMQLNLDSERPHVFLKELQLYIQHLKAEIEAAVPENARKFESYVEKFRKNLSEGISYYQELKSIWSLENEKMLEKLKEQVSGLKWELEQV